MPSYKKISIRKKNELTVIELQRPSRKNSLNPEMIGELKDALARYREDEGTRAILLTGSGDSFCAGADVKWFSEMLNDDDEEAKLSFKKEIEDFNRAMIEIQRMPKPLIAGINGSAAGAGISLAIACDITLVSDEAFFNYAYTNIGLTGDGGCTFFLPRAIGTKKALDLAMRSPKISAQEAVELGLATEVIPSENFEDRIMEIGEKLANGPTYALGKIKNLIRQSMGNSFESQLEAEEEAMCGAFETSDFREEGIEAFLNKEKPNFKGN